MSHKGKDPKIHIKTLSSYHGFGEGSYKMTMLKAIKGTNDFLAMSERERNCAVEDFEECRNKKLRELCQCVPWELSSIQVKAGKVYQQTIFSRRVQYAPWNKEIALNWTPAESTDAGLLVKESMLMLRRSAINHIYFRITMYILMSDHKVFIVVTGGGEVWKCQRWWKREGCGGVCNNDWRIQEV